MRVFPLVVVLTAGFALLSGCAEERHPPVGAPQPTSTGGDGGGGTGGGTAAGGGAGQGGGADTCGNGTLDDGEACEGQDLGGTTCENLGFNGGDLVCTSDCTFDTTGCSGSEDCTDGIDNDGDLKRDCQDEDCAQICADPCGYALIIDDPANVDGDTTGHGNTVDASCSSGAGSGPEVAYQLTAQTTGVLDVRLHSNLDLTVSLRTECSSAPSELDCVNRAVDPPNNEFLSHPINQNDTVFIIVDGFDDGEFGPYTLDVGTRVPQCGDAVIDRPGEQCDDGGTAPNDGCSATCQVESTETEPNDTSGTADPYPGTALWIGLIDPAGDVDYVLVPVAAAGSTILASIYDLGDGSCSGHMLDTVVDILDTNGTTVLASDDNGGEGSCSSVQAAGLGVGTYFVRVSAAAGASPDTFAYALDVSVQ